MEWGNSAWVGGCKPASLDGSKTQIAASGREPGPRFHKFKLAKKMLEPLALQPLAFHLAGAAHGLGSLTGSAFRRFLIVPSQFHLAEHALALHLLLERFQRLIDIVVTNENLHLAAFSSCLGHTQVWA